MQIPLKQYTSLLAHYLKPQQGRVVGLAIALLSSIGFQILNPQILGYFIDTAVSGGSQQKLLIAAFLFMGLALLTQILTVTATYLGEMVAWTATNALRLDLAKHCLNLDLSFHKSHTPGELLERVDGDVNLLSRFFSQLVIHVLGNGVLLLGILIILFAENLLAGVSLTLFSLIALSLLLGIQSVAVTPWAAYRQMSADFFGFLGEHLVGREDIRANGAVSYVMRRFYELLQRWLPIYQKARFASTILWSTSVGLFTLGNAIALAVSAYLWNQNAITIGTAYLIFHYTNLLNQPIERIREELEELQQVEASIHRIRELLNVRSQIQDLGNAHLPAGALSVSFQQVWFSYESIKQGNREQKITPSPSIHTLQNLSLHLPAGQTLGLLGRTGSGKSTIARLLLRLYDVQTGEIRLGNIPIAQTPLSELRQRVGLVTQDVQLFQASVRDNLTFFDARIRDTEILETLNNLELTEWLQSLPDGLDTQLGADSAGLSAGQAQLLAFARVFLKNPGLVILDEASSRLDPITEQCIERAIARLLHNRTGIIIAHRLATIQRVDQILMLEQGKVVEYGDRFTLQNDQRSRFSQLLKVNATTLMA
ncbi:ABC transporter ATP-binding protein [Oculatella sp. FACHB-28]|uniref:ABC transporter ATP-binding protein n=1 Tax=Oculatella sp. FACHB-28 TaxID=2692845 RepID=UPI0016842EEF|nr:ABC transporter ATP-binding protein [Oculatella sp. FACHB-28]MBD2055795.1 ABC transporter ATP-binding protein [Oculatella sp. FACHB-28]